MKAFLDKVSKIELSYYSVVLTKEEEVEKLREIFASVQMTETKEAVRGIMGGLQLVITYEDNRERHLGFTSKYLWDDEKTYLLDRDICQEVRSLFASLQTTL